MLSVKFSSRQSLLNRELGLYGPSTLSISPISLFKCVCVCLLASLGCLLACTACLSVCYSGWLSLCLSTCLVFFFFLYRRLSINFSLILVLINRQMLDEFQLLSFLINRSYLSLLTFMLFASVKSRQPSGSSPSVPCRKAHSLKVRTHEKREI